MVVGKWASRSYWSGAVAGDPASHERASLGDRIGWEPVIMLGSVILILTGLSAGLSPDVLPISVALFLLGLGWNFCYVGGSALQTDQLSTAEQSRMQGANDLFVGFASAIRGLGSRFVFAAVGYQTMGIIGAAFAIFPLAFVPNEVISIGSNVTSFFLPDS